jgi:lipoyl(octanoyl) transferase
MEFELWGQIPYEVCEEQQLKFVDEIAKGTRESTVVFCSHPPVVTLGRSTKPQDVGTWAGATFQVRRGGRATYHGPDQLVAYFLVNLNKPPLEIKIKDIFGLLRFIETSSIQLLNLYGLHARGKTLDPQLPSVTIDPNLNDTGVWVSEKKIASVGIAVRKWVSYHGIALNLYQSDLAFQGIQPCGFESQVMTNLEKELGRKVSSTEVINNWMSILKK